MSKTKLAPLTKIYEEYYKCSNSRCDSVYHQCNFRAEEFPCRDCGRSSEVPSEALPKRKPRSK